MGLLVLLCQCIAIPLAAFAVAQLLNRCIEKGYSHAADELEYPQALSSNRTKQRGLWLSATLTAAYGLAFISPHPWAELAMIIVSFTVLTAICITDFEQQIILDEFSLALVLLAILCIPVLSIDPIPHVLAGIGGFLFFLLFAVLTKGGIGGGDVKLIGALGLLLGPDRLMFTIATGAVAGGLVSLFLILSKRKSRKDAIAYGPYYAIAAMIAFLYL